MTREEHKAFLNRFDNEIRYCNDNPIDTIHIARREFISLMHDIETRMCENCKHFNEDEKRCLNEVSIAFTAQEAIYCDDGCNKFERKDNDK